MNLTEPQLRLLRLLQARDERGMRGLTVGGNRLRVAEALERKGLAQVGIGGSGIAYSGRWWYEATLTDEGRQA